MYFRFERCLDFNKATYLKSPTQYSRKEYIYLYIVGISQKNICIARKEPTEPHRKCPWLVIRATYRKYDPLRALFPPYFCTKTFTDTGLKKKEVMPGTLQHPRRSMHNPCPWDTVDTQISSSFHLAVNSYSEFKS